METQKEKSEPLRITAPLNYDVKVWMLLVDFFKKNVMVGRLSPFTHLVYRVCVISQFRLFRHWRELESNCHRKKRKRKKSHIRVRGPRRSEHCRIWQSFWSEVRGEEDEEDAEEEEVLCFDWKRDLGHVLYIRSIFLHGCSGKNVSPLKSLKNSAYFFFRTFCLWSKMLLQCYKTFTMFKCRS